MTAWHIACLDLDGAAGVAPMKSSFKSSGTERQKTRKQKKPSKGETLASIAQRYLELRRLRERVSEAESRAHVR